MIKKLILFLKWYLGLESEPKSVTWEAYLHKIKKLRLVKASGRNKRG
jgi:hypothetical protein